MRRIVCCLFLFLVVPLACFSQGSNVSGVSGGGSASAVAPSNGTNLLQTYTLTSTGAQAAINLTANPIDTHTISWRLSGSLSGAITDAIPYANGDLHTANANWVYQTGTFNVSSNVVYGSSATTLAYRSDGPNTANEGAQETVTETVVGATQNHGPCVRVSTSAFSGYCLQMATNQFNILLWNAGASTNLLTVASLTTTGDIGKITAVGTTISLYKNGILLGSITDATFSTGETGAYSAGSANSNGFSNFQSGQIGSCSIELDSSADGVNFNSGLTAPIPSQNCATSPNSSSQANASANYVRVNVTALTAGYALTVVYSGRLSPALPSSGAAPVSNGQVVYPGQVIWFQYTENFAPIVATGTSSGSGGIGNVDIHQSLTLIQPNGQPNTQSWDINPCNMNVIGGWGTGYTVTQQSILQAATGILVTSGFPQGTILANIYILNSMPAGGSQTGCVAGVLSGNIIGTILGSWITGSSLPFSFVGTTAIFQSAWSLPGFTASFPVTNPAAGADWTYNFTNGGSGVQGRICIQHVSFTLAAGSTNVTPVLVLSMNGNKWVYAATTAQTAGATQTYSFSPGANAETVTAGSTLYHIVPFDNGQLPCFNGGMTIDTISTQTTGINGTSQYSSIIITAQVQQDND